MIKHFKNSPADYALEYVRRGWNPVPIPFKSKRPTGDGLRFFNGEPQNVSVLMGQTSGGLADLDLDCPEAIAIAPFVLPRTGAIFGSISPGPTGFTRAIWQPPKTISRMRRRPKTRPY